MMDQKIISDYAEIFETYQEFKGDFLEEHVAKLKELDQYIPHSSTFFCITNTTTRSFEYVSKNFHPCTGLDTHEMLQKGMTYWWEHMHPDEMHLWLQSLNDLMQFTMSEIEVLDRKKISYTWNYRIKMQDGNYRPVLQHTTPMYFDEGGKPVIGLAHYSLLPMLNAMQAEENALLLRIQALRNKMLLTTILGAVVIVLWYFIAWLFYKSNANKSPKKFGKSKLRLAMVDDDRDLQNKEFLQLISHEFRAPISAIISALELIPNMEEQRTRLIQQAEQSSYRLLNLTNNLTDVLTNNTEDDLHFSDVDLISLLDECISPFSVRVKDKKIEFNMHCSHSVPHYAETDPVALSKVVVNILDNAVKFTANGLIDVTVTTLVKNQGIFLVIIISDTGIGIDEATQKRMFERFYRGEHSTGQRFPGAGIGLSVAKRSVDKLGGALQVTSTVGVGTEFKILLPLKPIEDLPATNSAPSNATFAVVDDLEISRLHLQSIITKEGFSARTFSSGANLLNLHEEILQFSGIIADLYMPGMNGLELVRTLKAIFGERVPPVIVLSATPDIANIIANSELPIYQSFVKPIDRNRFVDALHHLTASNARVVETTKKANVLLVEDEPINAEMVEYMLQCMGHEVTVSYTGDDAIIRVSESAFDCVLLDINLPDMNGLEVAKIMKEGHPDLPIIALTANAHRSDKEASLQAGIRYHLVKPVTFQELKNTLRLAL